MKHLFLFSFAMMGGMLFSAPVLEADFNAPGDFSLRNGDRKITSPVRNSGRIPLPGKVGNGALFANHNLGAFPETKGVAQGSLRFGGIQNFPCEKGALRLWICPSFNENTAPGRTPHNYIFRFFSSQGASRLLTLFVVNHKQLTLQFELENGKKSYLHYVVKDWKPGEWKQIDAVWSPGVQQLYVDGKFAQEKTVPGKLPPIDSLEVGGIDNYFPFQGVIDELSVSVEPPADLERKKSPASLAVVPQFAAPVKLAGNAGLLEAAQWTGDPGIRALPGKAMRLAYDGGEFRDRCIEGPAIPVKAGEFIRGDLAFRKKKWDFSCFAPAHVSFYNAAGKQVERRRFDQSNIKSYKPFALDEFQTPAAQDERIDYFNFWRVPAGATALRPGWTFRYNPAEIEIDTIEFFRVDGGNKPWFAVPAGKGDLTLAARAVSEAETDRILAARTPAHAELRKEGDRVELRVDGKRMMPFFMHNTPYPVSDVERWTAAFDRIGFRFATVHVALGQGIKTYPAALREDGSVDLSGWRKEVRKHLGQSPEGYLILAVEIFPTGRWLAEHDDQLMKDGRGVNFIYGYPHYPLGKGAAKELPKGKFSRYPSLFSELYTAHITNELKKVLKEFEKFPESKAVAGVYLVGGDDAQFRLPNIHTTPDQSPVALAGFRNYLREKYGTDAALKRAWNDPAASFDRVAIPVRPEIWPDAKRYYAEGGKNTMLSDYKACYSLSDRKFKSAIRKAAREALPRVLVGGYDCAYGMSGSWGHTGLYFGKAVDDDADFYLFIPSYGRDRDNADLALGAYQFSGSLALHGKLGIMELDVRNPEIGPLYFGHYRSANYVARHNAESFAVSTRRLAVQAVIQGGGFHYYNLQPHWCRTPKAMRALEEMRRIAAEARPVKNGRDAIALMIDEDSNLYSSTHPGWIPSFFNFKNIPVAAIQRAGVKFNYFLASDALHPDFEAPGVLFFADASTLTPETVAKIRKRHGNSGRVIVWHGAPGFLVCGDEKKIGEAINFQIARMPDYPNGAVGFDRDYDVKVKENNSPVPLVVSNSADRLVDGMSGFFMQESPIVPRVFSPHWKVVDPRAVPLATFYGSSEVGMAVKRHKDFTEVFIGQPGAVTPRLLRNLAQEAGVTPSLDTDDIFYCGGGLLAVGASRGSGVRKIRFPEGFSRAEALTGHKVLNQTSKGFETDIAHRDIAVFKLHEAK